MGFAVSYFKELVYRQNCVLLSRFCSLLDELFDRLSMFGANSGTVYVFMICSPHKPCSFYQKSRIGVNRPFDPHLSLLAEFSQ